MSRRAVAALLLWLTVMVVAHSYVNTTYPTKPNGAIVCEEDEPCWDCKTMGNQICGPVN